MEENQRFDQFVLNTDEKKIYLFKITSIVVEPDFVGGDSGEYCREHTLYHIDSLPGEYVYVLDQELKHLLRVFPTSVLGDYHHYVGVRGRKADYLRAYKEPLKTETVYETLVASDNLIMGVYQSHDLELVDILDADSVTWESLLQGEQYGAEI